MIPKRNSHVDGHRAEDLALEFLQEQKLKLLERNYRTAQGEIDLIMRDKEILVFVEVRSRTGNRILEAVETIDIHKRNRIVQASQHYLQRHGIGNKAICRFDVIILSGPLAAGKIEWIKNAFEA